MNLSTLEDKHFSQLRSQLYSTLSSSSSTSSSGLPPPSLGQSLSSSSLRFSTSSGFTNTKQGTHWSPLLRTLLVQLGSSYQLLADRGVPRPAPLPIAAPPPTGQSTSLPDHLLGSELKLRRDASIFKSGPLSQSQTFGSSSAVAAVADELVDTAALPEIFRSSTIQVVNAASAKSSEIIAAPVAVVEKAKGSLMAYVPTAQVSGTVARVVPAPVKSQYAVVSGWWSNQRQGKQVERMVSAWEIDVFAIQGTLRPSSSLSPADKTCSAALTALTAHSFTQDSYGIVQRDIPRILESLCVLLHEVQEVKTEYQLPSSSDDIPSALVSSRAEFREGLRGLSALEDGAFVLLIRLEWVNG